MKTKIGIWATWLAGVACLFGSMFTNGMNETYWALSLAAVGLILAAVAWALRWAK